MPEIEYAKAYNSIIEKECLCVGLGVASKLSNNIPVKPSDKVTVCPGPNLAYFSNEVSLNDMVDHIYGRKDILDDRPRPHMFLKELDMYLDIFKKRIEAFLKSPDNKKEKRQLTMFKKNMLEGIQYYKELFNTKKKEVVTELENMLKKYPALHQDIDIAEKVE